MRRFNPRKVKTSLRLDRLVRTVTPVLRRLAPPRKPRANVNRILVYEAWMLGDFVMATAALRLLREAFPEARIDCICPQAFAGMEAFFPYVDRLIPFRAPWHYSESPTWRHLKHTLELARRLRREDYDWAFDLRGDIRDIVFLYFTGARRRAAFDLTGGRSLLTHPVHYESDRYRHQAEGNNLVVLRALGDERPPTVSVPQIRVPDSERRYASRWIAERGLSVFAGVQISASSVTKAWPTENWARVLNRRVLPRMPVVLFGAEHDEFTPLLDQLTDRSRVFVNRDPLPRFIALVAEATIFLGLDSFAAHVAGAVGTPVISVHGPVHPDLSRPYGARGEAICLEDVPCRTCHGNRCTQERNFCILDLPVHRVEDALDRLEFASQPRAASGQSYGL